MSLTVSLFLSSNSTVQKDKQACKQIQNKDICFQGGW